MDLSHKKILLGSLSVIVLMFTGITTAGILLFTKQVGKMRELSLSSIKNTTQTAQAKAMIADVANKLDLLINAKGSSSQPLGYNFVNNSNLAQIVGSFQETPIINNNIIPITIIPKSDPISITNVPNVVSMLKRDSALANKVGRHISIVQKILSQTPGANSSPSGGYAVKVVSSMIDPNDNTQAVYNLAIVGYVCDSGDAATGACNDSSNLGFASQTYIKKRRCINTTAKQNGEQLIVASNPGTDFYNLNCTCPNNKEIKADGTCKLSCPAGKFNNNGSCQDCPPETWSLVGATSCNSCNGCSGSSCSSTQGCISCPAGYRLSGNACIACSPGTYSTPLTSMFGCSLCDSGHYAPNSGSSSCMQCPVGYYAANQGSTACTPCPANTYSTMLNLSSCTPCLDNAYSNPGSASCVNCPSGSYRNGTGVATSVPLCKCTPNKPQWSTKFNTKCYYCPEGAKYCQGQITTTTPVLSLQRKTDEHNILIYLTKKGVQYEYCPSVNHYFLPN